MMGLQAEAAQRFCDFRLDDHVPGDHLLRGIDRFLDLTSIRSELKPFYSAIGRPSIDPELMIRMLVVGYCMGIRSERRLCEEVHLNLAYRWFCRLGLDGRVPDHSTFSRNRHGRFRDSDILRHLFETVVGRCMSEGLVGGEGFAVDASLIAADAKVHFSCRPGGPMDRRTQGPCLLRLCHQLFDRHRQCGHPGCRSHPGDPASRGRRGADHARPDRGSLRAEADVSGRRQCLRIGDEPRLAGQGKGDRAAHPDVRQIRSHRWHVLTRRLHV